MDYEYKDFNAAAEWKLYSAYLVVKDIPKFKYNNTPTAAVIAPVPAAAATTDATATPSGDSNSDSPQNPVALDQVMSNSSRGTGHGIKKAAKIKKKKEDDTKKAAEKAAKQEKRDDNKRQRAEERSAVTNQAGKQIDGNCEPEIGGEQAQSFGLFDRFGGHLRPGSKQCPPHPGVQ